MRMSALLVLSVFAATALPAAGGDTKLKKPSLTLRSSPRFAFSPARVLFVAELSGGDDVEEYYCPELEWDWDDGGRSTKESDCAPYQPGTPIERRFTAEHGYGLAGTYNVKVTFRRSGRTFASQTVRVMVPVGDTDRFGRPRWS